MTHSIITNVFEKQYQRGYEVKIVDPNNKEEFAHWQYATYVGFLEEYDLNERTIEEYRQCFLNYRSVGIYDPRTLSPEIPIATVSSYQTPLHTPGAQVSALAVTCLVTASTHQRQGLSRAMITEQLQLAKEQNLAVVVLTASEAGIYGRYGFGQATWSNNLCLMTRDFALKPQFAELVKSVRINAVKPQKLLQSVNDLYNRTLSNGDVARHEPWWRMALRITELRIYNHGRSGETYAFIATDPDYPVDSADDVDRVRGYVIYRVETGDPDKIVVDDFIAETPGAYLALWNLLANVGLVGEVHCAARPIDEPLIHAVQDSRAVQLRNRADSLWLRIIDVPLALAGRKYLAPGKVVLKISDDLGFAGGTYELTVTSDFSGQVKELNDEAKIVAGNCIEMNVQTLAMAYLGANSIRALQQAGLITGPQSQIATLDRMFASTTQPFLRTPF